MRRHPLRRLALAGSLLFRPVCLPTGLTGQPARPPITVDVHLVVVPVTVTDGAGAVVTGLKQEHFRVFEDKAPREIVSFASEDTPASVGLLIDVSGSMRSTSARVRAAARALLESLGPDDEAFLLTFSSRPETVVEFTSEPRVIHDRLLQARFGGRTSLMDAVQHALGRMRSARHSRKAMVIVSDGMDNFSRYSRGELMGRVAEADVQVHALAVQEPPINHKLIELRVQRQGLSLLEDLAGASGGLYFPVRNEAEAPPAARQIGRVLHDQYLLGYYTPRAAGGKWRRIQVKVDLPHAHAYARSGYLAPD